MSIKRRRTKIKPKKLTPERALNRMADIAEHFDNAEFAEIYINSFHENMLARLQSIAKKAEAERNWKFMDGCFKQATELYLLASVLYEKFPEHVILSDGAFDALAKWLLRNRKKIDPEFWMWYNVTAMGLKAGSGYNVIARDPIPQYVYILTGQLIEEDDGKASRDRPRVLRKKPRRRVKSSSRSDRGSIKRLVRKSRRREKSDTSS